MGFSGIRTKPHPYTLRTVLAAVLVLRCMLGRTNVRLSWEVNDDDLHRHEGPQEQSPDGSHRHIEGVCTEGGTHYTRKQVVDSINAGNTWKTRADGYEAIIKPIARCRKLNCSATPYIETNPDSTRKDNLENLDLC